LAFGVGFLSGKLSVERRPPPIMSEAIGPVMVEGWVTEIEPARRGRRVRLDVHRVANVTNEMRLQRVRLTHIRALDVDVGRFVRCWSVLRPPPSAVLPQDYAFDRQAYFEGLDAVGYVQGSCRAMAMGPRAGIGGGISHWVATSRRRLALYVADRAGDRAGGFAAALVSGDRSLMSEQDREALRRSGLAHLMAISGLHMGLVCGLVYFIVRRALGFVEPLALSVFIRKPAAVAALLAGLAYLIMSGGSVSTQRAYIMALVFFSAILVDRRALSLQSLGLAMICIVLWEPWSVLTPGFQMSFAATGALVATYEAWRVRRSARQLPLRGTAFWFKSLVVTALVSSVATAPFGVYHFDRVAALGVVANLFAMPVVSLWSAPAAIMAALLAPLGLDGPILFVFGKSLETVLAVAHQFSVLGSDFGSAQKNMPMPAFVGFSLSVAGLCIAQKRMRFLSCLPALIGGISWLSAPMVGVHVSPRGDIFYRALDGSIQRVQFENGKGLVPIGWRDIEPAEDCRQNSCDLHTPNGILLVITDQRELRCDALGNVRLLISRRPVTLLGECYLPTVVWPDIDPQRGATWMFGGDQVFERTLRACGLRPWQICPSAIRTVE
ncbi:MAG: ComEC/Rec2 family competence protein, partial [Pseudomonadota bacterium]